MGTETPFRSRLSRAEERAIVDALVFCLAGEYEEIFEDEAAADAAQRALDKMIRRLGR